MIYELGLYNARGLEVLDARTHDNLFRAIRSGPCFYDRETRDERTAAIRSKGAWGGCSDDGDIVAIGLTPEATRAAFLSAMLDGIPDGVREWDPMETPGRVNNALALPDPAPDHFRVDGFDPARGTITVYPKSTAAKALVDTYCRDKHGRVMVQVDRFNKMLAKLAKGDS